MGWGKKISDMCKKEWDSGEQPGPEMIGKPRVGYSVPQFGKVFVCPCVLYSEKALLGDYGWLKKGGGYCLSLMMLMVFGERKCDFSSDLEYGMNDAIGV